MKLRRSYIISISISMFLWLLPACGYGNGEPLDIGDGGLLSGNPCSAPCFRNIIPGATTESQTMGILSSIVDIRACDRWEKSNSGRDRGMRCSNIGITFNDLNIVNIVSFQPSEEVTVDEVINKYGNPDGIGIGVLGIEMQPPIAMRLYFDKVKMVVYLPEQNSTSYNLQPDIQIESIAYEEESQYIIGKSSAQPWKGFGKY